MQEIVLFLMTYLLLFIIYQLFIVRKASKRNSKKKPIEIIYLVSRYKIDLKKVDYKKLLLIISLVSSLDISIIVTFVSIFNNYFIKFLIALVLVIPIILFSYSFIGKYYKKKGMIIDE